MSPAFVFLRLTLLVAVSGCACPGPHTLDGSIADGGGLDAAVPDASVEILDGGTIIYGRGCVSPDKSKVIFTLDSREPQWCAFISMRRWDGGFPARFPEFRGPQDFKVDDARWGVCRDLELPTSLEQDSIPLDELSGEFNFRLIFDGRPRSYDFDGGLRMGPYRFSATVFAGLTRDCKGN